MNRDINQAGRLPAALQVSDMVKSGNNDEYRIEPAQRITRLPPYLFGRLNALKHAKRQQGADIIDLGMGNPTDSAPQIVIEKLCEAAHDPRNHRYSASKGIQNLRKERGLEVTDRIALTLDGSDAVRAAAERFKDHLMAETLAVSWSWGPSADAAEIECGEGTVRASVVKAPA